MCWGGGLNTHLKAHVFKEPVLYLAVHDKRPSLVFFFHGYSSIHPLCSPYSIVYLLHSFVNPTKYLLFSYVEMSFSFRNTRGIHSRKCLEL